MTKPREIEELLDIDVGLAVLIQRCFRVINKVRQKEIGDFGITVSQSAIIRTIYRLGKEATASKISDQLFLEPNSVSEQLSRMEKDGLVKRAKEADKKKAAKLVVTKKGHEVFLNTLEQESAHRIMSVLNAEEKMGLWLALTKIRERAARELGIHINEYYPPAEPPL